MGQELASQQKSQKVMNSNDQPTLTSSQEGLLKISPYPFAHSIKITGSALTSSMYAQKCKTLQSEILSRKPQLKYFPQSQIIDFIESTVYTFVNFEQQGIIYKDINAQNVFMVEEKNKNKAQYLKCKILPNDLIEQTAYQRLQRINKRVIQHEKCFTFSPEMIIALRARQKMFNDLSLQKKSSVFALGIVLLEAATLRLSCDFYDTVTFDIYEEEIERCLAEVDGRYGSVVVRIIANMIDFDFQERIEGFTELAKWIVYEIQNPNQNNSKGNSIPIAISKRSLHHQSVETLPICLETRNNIQTIESMVKIHQQKQNIPTQNKINIKVRQVSVYLEKNSHFQNTKENKSRLLYSPFLSTSSDTKSDLDFIQHPKMDLVKQYSRRGLAFESTSSKTKRSYFIQNLAPLSNYLRTHR